jgi:hypothetical protein
MPAYRERGYWWRERSGVQFLKGNFAEAAGGYLTAVELGDERSRPLLADALMFSGHYRDALEQFVAVGRIQHDETPEWALKRRALRYLVENFGIEEHQRHAELADVAADQTDDREALREALFLDLLCGRALWKLGHLAADDDEPNFDLFLASAVADPFQPVAWIGALKSAFAEAPELVAAVGMTARRFARHEIVDFVLTSSDLDGSVFADAIEELFDELPPDPPGPVEVRVVGTEADAVAIIDLTEPPGNSIG